MVKLERLIEAAKSAPATIAQPMPEALKIRLLAHLRSQSGIPSPMELLQAVRLVFRLGLGLACVIMLACLAWSYKDLTRQPDNDVEAATVRAHVDLQL